MGLNNPPGQSPGNGGGGTGRPGGNSSDSRGRNRNLVRLPGRGNGTPLKVPLAATKRLCDQLDVGAEAVPQGFGTSRLKTATVPKDLMAPEGQGGRDLYMSEAEYWKKGIILTGLQEVFCLRQ
jgi:hypothetical protein